MKSFKLGKVGLISFLIGIALGNSININGGFEDEWKNTIFIKLPLVLFIYFLFGYYFSGN